MRVTIKCQKEKNLRNWAIWNVNFNFLLFMGNLSRIVASLAPSSADNQRRSEISFPIRRSFASFPYQTTVSRELTHMRMDGGRFATFVWTRDICSLHLTTSNFNQRWSGRKSDCQSIETSLRAIWGLAVMTPRHVAFDSEYQITQKLASTRYFRSRLTISSLVFVLIPLDMCSINFESIAFVYI